MQGSTVDFGIDLGTTNSAIVGPRDGALAIYKSEHQTDTSPSCVSFEKRVVKTGVAALTALGREEDRRLRSGGGAPNGFVEFKRTMGTTALYHSPDMARNFSSEELSAEVLKSLKQHSNVPEGLRAAVITVPARFQHNQVAATQRAAELAGFEYVELLQEPIAASLAYGFDAARVGGYWLVFDFGGGTFDAALMKVDGGVMRVVDTDGDNHLGGKNIDLAIVDNILLPYLRKNFALGSLEDPQARLLWESVLKRIAEEAKVTLSSRSAHQIASVEPLCTDDAGKPVELNLTLGLAEFESVVAPIYGRAIVIAQRLLERNGVDSGNLAAVIPVGGPTLSQTFRRMISEAIPSRLETGIDPMTAVARGAAVFASTCLIPDRLRERDASRVQLTLKYPSSTVESEENVGVRVDRLLSTENLPLILYAELSRTDGAWNSGRIHLDGDAEIIPVLLGDAKASEYAVRISDDKGNILECEPNSLRILGGMKVAKATLTDDVCVEALDSTKNRELLVKLDGLEKNQPLPARGKGRFRTQKDIRPGNSSDRLLIPVYEGLPGSRAVHNIHQFTVPVTGEDLPSFLPAESEVEITVAVDESRRKAVTAYFPYLDETVEVAIDTYDRDKADPRELERHADEMAHSLEALGAHPGVDAEETAKLRRELQELEQMLGRSRGDHDSVIQAEDRVKELAKKIDQLQEEGEWPLADKELEDALKRLRVNVQRYGDARASALLADVEQRATAVREQRNASQASDLAVEARAIDFALVSSDAGFWLALLKGYADDFELHPWSDRRAARSILDRAAQHAARSASRSDLEGYVRQLFALLPSGHEPLSETPRNQEMLRR